MGSNYVSPAANEAVLFRQATGYFEQGQLEEAEKLLNRIIDSDPKYADAYQLSGLLSARRGQYDIAIRLFSTAIELNPAKPSYYYNLGLSLQSVDRLEEALCAYDNGIEINPDIAQLHINRSAVLKKLDRLDEVLLACDRAVELEPGNTSAHYNRGVTLRDLNRQQDALVAYDNVLELDPGNINTMYYRAQALCDLGYIDEAESIYRRIIEGTPDYYEAYRSLAYIRKMEPGDGLVTEMEKLLSGPTVDNASRIELGFALGKSYGDMGIYEKSMSFYMRANRLKRETINHSSEVDKRIASFLCNTFTRDYVSEHSEDGLPDDVPIFIVGMPRSGTTLVEQILTSHPLVTIGGELPYVMRLVVRGESGNELERLSWLANPVSGGFREKAKFYLHQLNFLSRDGSQHITDKMPSNFWFIGFIRMMLPNARIIHVKRDPRDTCLSIFTQLFAGDHPYAYDLKELGEYYRLYQFLMQHWEKIFPGFMHEVSYEELVQDFDAEVGRLLEYCELPFDERCLRFHESDTGVKTASFTQVRQPVYSGSVGRWRNYKEFLEPLLLALDGEFRPIAEDEY